jgi:hypothetical protein
LKALPAYPKQIRAAGLFPRNGNGAICRKNMGKNIYGNMRKNMEKKAVPTVLGRSGREKL